MKLPNGASARVNFEKLTGLLAELVKHARPMDGAEILHVRGLASL